MGTKFLRIVPLFFGICIVVLQPCRVLGALVTDVRCWSAPDHTRIVLDLTEPIRYESSSQENPPQFFLELEGISFPRLKRMREVKDPFLTKRERRSVSLTPVMVGKIREPLVRKRRWRRILY